MPVGILGDMAKARELLDAMYYPSDRPKLMEVFPTQRMIDSDSLPPTVTLDMLVAE